MYGCSEEIADILHGSSWLKSLLAAVENLPIGASLATASKKRPNFPLIYVNAIFESYTGYCRRDIVGKNCKFLQCSETEPESIIALSVALRNVRQK